MGPWLITLLICVSTTKEYGVWVYAYAIIVLQLTGNFSWMQTAFWKYRLVYSALMNFLAETSTIPRNKTGFDILLTNDCQQNISLQQVMVPQCHVTSSSPPSATKCWKMPLPAQLECTLPTVSTHKNIFPPVLYFNTTRYKILHTDKYYWKMNKSNKNDNKIHTALWQVG